MTGAELTRAQKLALDHARHLADNGVPLFLARPALDGDGKWDPQDGHQGTGYWLPQGWPQTKADPSVVDQWRPGMALCAVMGHLVDLLDVDPRSGGTESAALMTASGLVPRSYGRQATPSGGSHDLIAALGERSLDKVLPGVDVKAGDSEGAGRGFAFLAPTVKRSKATGRVASYEWVAAPEVDTLALIGGDDTGSALAELMRGRGHSDPYDGPMYDGLAYDDLTVAERRLADTHVESVEQQWSDRLREALAWPEGETDASGRGWEKLARDCAWHLAVTTAAPWTPWSASDAEQAYGRVLPEEFAAAEECQGKWTDSLVRKTQALPVQPPWWTDFLPVDQPDDPEAWPDVPPRLDDAHLAAWMAHKGLEGHWCWGGGLGWLAWDGRRWVSRCEEDVREAVRLANIQVNASALADRPSADDMKRFAGLLSSGRIGSLAVLMRGVVSVVAGDFDQERDLLNVGNGVVDLRTGELLPHDPALRMTRITETPYAPGAPHADWDKVLAALDPEVADWMQVRFGQAATGYPTSDDVLPIGQGGGSNGKTTLLSGLFGALGDHMKQVPEKLLRASPNDHPTELMTLFGARIAVIDETPEVATLNVPRLKATLGQEYMTARPVHKNNVRWRATHSLFVMSNYRPAVVETDHGTWRRLALVRFTKTFPKDDRFRTRITEGKDGRHEAVLAWVVEGARRWYANGKVIPAAPARVVADTLAWRGETDLVLAYANEQLVFDRDACVLSLELLQDFNFWVAERGHKAWADKTFSARFGDHSETTRNGVHKVQTRDLKGLVKGKGTDPGNRPHVWRGVRWRRSDDDSE